ncbi:hypothetical protein APED_18525 [Acanthopleuribacter pedis]
MSGIFARAVLKCTAVPVHHTKDRQPSLLRFHLMREWLGNVSDCG